jgi:hypothetical protein
MAGRRHRHSWAWLGSNDMLFDHDSCAREGVG